MALLDEFSGWFLQVAGQPRVRTAYLRTVFRAVTPAQQGLDLTVEMTA